MGERDSAPRSKSSRGRGQALRSDRLSDASIVKRKGWFFWEIAEVTFRATLERRDLDAYSRADHRKYIDEYFLTPIKIFERPEPSKQLGLWSRYLTPGFISNRLWPGYLEDRLKKLHHERLGHVDTKVKSLIEDVMAIFEHNIGCYIAWKRTVQAAIIVLVQAVSVAATVWMLKSEDPWSLLSVIGVMVAAGVGYSIFTGLNARIFKDYEEALRHSVRESATKIKDRINSLFTLFGQYEESILEIEKRGENQSKGDAAAGEDANSARFYTEMRLWLAHRVEGIQFALLYEMQIAQRHHFFLDVLGFAVAGGILLVGLAVPVGILILVATLQIQGASEVWWAHALTQLALTLVAITTLSFTILISWLSYYNARWNSAKDILFRYFDLSEWQTFDKFALHRAIGMRIQSSMDQIRHLDEQLGAKGR